MKKETSRSILKRVQSATGTAILIDAVNIKRLDELRLQKQLLGDSEQDDFEMACELAACFELL